jgi:hypothetical protein
MRNQAQLAWRSPLAILSLILAIAIIFLGANFIVDPHAAATAYGVRVSSTDADPFLMAKGLRDVASGLVLASLLAFAPARAVGLFVLAMTVVPFGDAALVATTGHAPAYAVPMHAITGLVMLTMSLLMIRRSRHTRAEQGAVK